MRRFLSALIVICLVCTMLYWPASAVDDHTPPVVTGVYINSPNTTVTAGDKLILSVAAKDDVRLDWMYLYFTCTCESGYEHKFEVEAFYSKNYGRQ